MAVQLQYPLEVLGNEEFGNNYVLFSVYKSSAHRALEAEKGLIDTVNKVMEDPGSIIKEGTQLFEDITQAFTSPKDFQAERNSGVLETSKSAAKEAKEAGKGTSKGNKQVKFPTSKQGQSLADIVLMLPAVIPAASYNATYEDFNLTDAITNALPGAVNKFKSYGSYITRMAINPMREQLFKGVDNRTFSFKYEFLPKNEKEADEVQNIIRQFKYHMLPELAAGTFMYKFPSEFVIEYRHGELENAFINKITSCVLTACNVEYSPRGSAALFDTGCPIHIDMSLTFKELAQLDKKSLMEKDL